MDKFLRNLLYLLCFAITLGGCRKKAFDEYYGRPANLQPPIYQVLQQRGNFTNFLKLIDRSGYKTTLSTAGYWTLFAPNDAAFQKYFTDSTTSIDKIDSVMARQIVTYCLVYNADETDHISDYESNKGWVIGKAFKRRTAYYDGVYNDVINGVAKTIIASNRNPSTNAGVGYVFGDNNNKYIPYFTNLFMSTAGITASDYNYFFPNVTYSGFNVVDAKVVNPNIVAENGIIHEVDKVLTPLPSLEQYLIKNPNYSLFKSLLDQYMVRYTANADATHRNTVLTKSTDSVFVKLYSALLAFAPNNENFLKAQDNDSQSDGYSMFVPSNDVLTKYLNDVILENYKTIDKLPLQIIADLLNAHMFQTTVWPSKFSTTNNFQGEPARFNANSGDITDKKFCSNGLFYGTSKVQEANVFSSIYGKVYLDPNYSLMNKLLDLNLKFTITSPNVKFTMFLIPDAVLRNLGYDFSSASNTFTYTANGVTTVGGSVVTQLNRILNAHIVLTPHNELDNLSGSGIIETLNGDYIKWNNNTVFAAGNVDAGNSLAITATKTANNGRVYYQNSGVLLSSTNTIAYQINKYGTKVTDPFYDFNQYLKNSQLYNVATNEITGINLGTPYTVFVPTKAAIVNAVKQGWLPGAPATGVPNYAPTTPADQLLVVHFIQAHIINGTSIATDGIKTGAFSTLFKNLNGDVSNITVSGTANNIKIVDDRGASANLVSPVNTLANYALIHQIDNFMTYTN